MLDAYYSPAISDIVPTISPVGSGSDSNNTICELNTRVRPQPALRPPGEMASRLTTNQEIAGSTPAVVI